MMIVVYTCYSDALRHNAGQAVTTTELCEYDCALFWNDGDGSISVSCCKT